MNKRYWVSCIDGKVADDQNDWVNSRKLLWDLRLEQYHSMFEHYQIEHLSTIKEVGFKAGLALVEDGLDKTLIQFNLPSNAVSAALVNIVKGIEALKLQVVNIVIQNLRYDETIKVPWKEFLGDLKAGKKIMLNEHSPESYDRQMMNRIEQRFRTNGW